MFVTIFYLDWTTITQPTNQICVFIYARSSLIPEYGRLTMTVTSNNKISFDNI